jgi:colanic acid/amylovoran biosynthesis glycosyltransferase
MNNMLIISSEYPYGHKEQFLHNEINLLKKDFSITIIPTKISKKNLLRPDISNCRIVEIRKTRFIIKFWSLVLTILFFINSIFIKEFIYVLKRNEKIKNLFHLIKFTIKGEYKYRLIERSITSLNNKDLVIYSYWLYYQSFIASRIKNNYELPAFSRAHGFDLYEYRNKGKYIPYRNFILNSINNIFLISNDGKKYLSSKYNKYIDKYIVNRLGTFDQGLSKSLANSAIRIVSCSWVVPVKRVNLIVEALSIINNLKIEWIHFGNGPLTNQINDMCKSLPENIKYSLRGSVKNEEILSFYKNNHVDLFVNVSESEGIPVSIMEASSFGIPIIATNVGGVSEIVIEGQNGYLLKKHFDIIELTGLIKKYQLLTLNEKNHLRENSRNIWDANYNITNNVKDLSNEIKKLY